MDEELYEIEDFSTPITFKYVKGDIISVFWDVEDYPFPVGFKPDLIYKEIVSALDYGGCSGEIKIWVYADEKKDSSWDKFLREKTWKDKIYFLPGGGDKPARRTRMLHDILLWSMDMDMVSSVNYPYLFVISDKVREDEEFFGRLDILSARHFIVYLIQPTGDCSSESPEWPGLLFDQAYSFLTESFVAKSSEEEEGSLKNQKATAAEGTT